ncbi:MAG TPA: hypothetical protein PK880_02340 [Candidatus Competibacter sp.]|nr:hypothetical protein [Candidatus Competibacteraceae bacterium]HRC71353.1 hypothetical protein [Candidatus Competibacter sp.]
MSAPSERTAGPLLLDLATVTALLTALGYFTGWTYAYHYFGHFKLGLLTLEIPTEYFFVYGFWVFKTWWWLVIPYGLGIVLLAFYESRLSPRLDRLKTERPRLLKQLQILGVLLAFLLAWWLAAVSAGWYYQAQQDNGFLAYPHVRVWPNEPLPEDATLKELYGELPGGVYRLLLENKETLFLFKLPPDGKPARLPVIKLPLKEVKLLRVLP